MSDSYSVLSSWDSCFDLELGERLPESHFNYSAKIKKLVLSLSGWLGRHTFYITWGDQSAVACELWESCRANELSQKGDLRGLSDQTAPENPYPQNVIGN